jgi:hypothetical protein
MYGHTCCLRCQHASYSEQDSLRVVLIRSTLPSKVARLGITILTLCKLILSGVMPLRPSVSVALGRLLSIYYQSDALESCNRTNSLRHDLLDIDIDSVLALPRSRYLEDLAAHLL